jgi:hypothetical protein
MLNPEQIDRLRQVIQIIDDERDRIEARRNGDGGKHLHPTG